MKRGKIFILIKSIQMKCQNEALDESFQNSSSLGVALNVPPFAKREAKELLVKLPPRAKRDARRSLAT